jgi:hypothetical protein
MLPPVDRQGQMFANLQLAMGAASTVTSVIPGGKSN